MQLEFVSDVKELRRQYEEAQKLVGSLREAIEAREELCEHSWRCIASGHRGDIVECTKCGATDER